MFFRKKWESESYYKRSEKVNSSKASYFQPLNYIDIIYNHKLNRELHVVSKVSYKKFWSKILEDLHKVSLAISILELTDKTLSDNDPHPSLF